MAEGKVGETLISFRSGHYKKVKGKWKGDSVWCHFIKDEGGMVHVNKEEVEYMETFAEKWPEVDLDKKDSAKVLQDRKRAHYETVEDTATEKGPRGGTNLPNKP